jgi:hypothetical protein
MTSVLLKPIKLLLGDNFLLFYCLVFNLIQFAFRLFVYEVDIFLLFGLLLVL